MDPTSFLSDFKGCKKNFSIFFFLITHPQAQYLCRWGSSIANPQQRVAIVGSTPLLDGNWRTQGTRKQLRTTEIGPSFFFMMYISFAVKIHRSTITTVARPQLAGSREPVTKAK
jgi:hypothetical protein